MGVHISRGINVGVGSIDGLGGDMIKCIPEGVIALKMPAKVIRAIIEHDRTGYWAN